MPTYVYRREDGTTFEVVQRITDEPLAVDPETGQKVQRVITGAGLIFKGSGFYLTDYTDYGKGAKKAEGAKTESSKATESAPVPESKPAATPETKPAAAPEPA